MNSTYPKNAFTGQLTAYDFEKLTVTNGAVITPTLSKLTAANKQPCVRAWITVEDADLRYTVHKADPSATSGHRGYQDGTIKIQGAKNIAALRMIAITATNATVYITYERYEE